MKQNRQAAIIVVLAALALLAVVAWWRSTHVRVQKTLDLPPIGEAAYNPLYALRKTLEHAGAEVESRQRLSLPAMALKAGDTVLMLSDAGALSAQDTDAVLRWVAEGGHLILQVSSYSRPSARSERSSSLLGELGIGIAKSFGDCVNLQYRGTKTTLFCGAPRIVIGKDEPTAARLRDGDGQDVMVRLAHGRGTVDVLAGLDFLTRGQLENKANAALARQLLQPGHGMGTVHLIYRAQMPALWQMLLEKAWPVWVPLVIALFVWLWARMQRFGPLLPSPSLARRSLIEHVQAAGEHVLRYGRGHLLYDAVKQAFDARLRRRDPLAAALTGAAQYDAIAARTTASAAEVEEALRPPKPHDAADLRLRISRLIRLRNRL